MNKLSLPLLVLMLGFSLSAPPVEAATATIWNGPLLSYSQPTPDPTQAANQDRLTPNVWLTRGSVQGLFNAHAESAFTHFLSPVDTSWADGTTANYSSLSYTDWDTWSKNIHGGPPNTVGVNAVLHLVSENIYLNIKFTSWGGASGGFSYQRSTPTVAPEPSSALLLLAGLLAGVGLPYFRRQGRC